MYIYKGKIIKPESDFGNQEIIKLLDKPFIINYVSKDSILSYPAEVIIISDYFRYSVGYYSHLDEVSFTFKDIDEAVEFYKEVMKFIKEEESEFEVVELTFTPFSVYEEKEYRKDKFYLEVVDNKPYIATSEGCISYDGGILSLLDYDEYIGEEHIISKFSITYEFDSLPELARNMGELPLS